MNSYKFSMDADNDAEGETSQIIILQGGAVFNFFVEVKVCLVNKICGRVGY